MGKVLGQRLSRLIMLSDETSDGGSQITFRVKMGEEHELAAVTGTSGAVTSSVKPRTNRKGKTSDQCDYDRASCGPVFRYPLNEGAGYAGGRNRLWGTRVSTERAVT